MPQICGLPPGRPKDDLVRAKKRILITRRYPLLSPRSAGFETIQMLRGQPVSCARPQGGGLSGYARTHAYDKAHFPVRPAKRHGFASDSKVTKLCFYDIIPLQIKMLSRPGRVRICAGELFWPGAKAPRAWRGSRFLAILLPVIGPLLSWQASAAAEVLLHLSLKGPVSTFSLFDGTVNRLFEVVPESGSGVLLAALRGFASGFEGRRPVGPCALRHLRAWRG